MRKVLIVATGRHTKGGITSVIKIHEKMNFWKEHNCEWLETHCDGNTIKKIIMFLRAFLKFIFKIFTVKIIHVHLSWKISVLRKLPYIILAKLFNKKIIIHVHASAETTYLKNKILYKLVFILASKIIYIYPSFFKNKNVLFKKKSELVFNPVASSSVVDLSKKKNQIVYLGSLNEKKGIFDLIIAFSKISKRNPLWSLKIGGTGDFRKCEILITKLNLESKVDLLGWVDEEAKQKLLEESMIFCLPSYTEGFPMSLIEAWQHKVVPIASNVGGIPDVLIDKVNGLLIKPGDINRLSENLELIISNKKLYISLQIEAERTYKKSFENTKIDANLSKIYASLC